MQKGEVGKSGMQASRLIQGCMRFDELSQQEATQLVATSFECGINMFDNADIYGAGECEIKCGQALKGAKIPREDVIVQTKCGIENYQYDFSKQHILNSVDRSLGRLGTDYIDILLLHRPDALAQPEEIAEAFDLLATNGKVRNFGVSNMHPMQIELLQKHVGQKIQANQLQISPVHTSMIDCGILVNYSEAPGSIHHDGMVLDYCRLKDITIQAWSPFQKGHIDGTFMNDPEYKELNDAISHMAAAKGTNPEAIVAAWLLRHPANMQVIAGTTKPTRIKAMCEAFDHTLTRDEWYAIYKAGGHLVP